MAEFRKIVITNEGQALLAKTLAEQRKITFTKISFSEVEYSDLEILSLTELSGTKQTTDKINVSKKTETSIKVQGLITNESLSKGYYMKTIALYAKDTDENEIIYAVCSTSSPDWMPAFGGASTSSISLQLIIQVSNASSISLTVDSTGFASITDIFNLQNQIETVQSAQTTLESAQSRMENKQTQQAENLENLQNKIVNLQDFVGYSDTDIYGVEVDYKNNVFTRLSAATALEPGIDFNKLAAFGGRKRCILTDNGKVLAYYGEPGYTEEGKLTQQIIKNEVTYPIGTMVQVMVEQPKFYYKVVPIQLEKIENGTGFHIRKARYYISDTPKTGFKIHPAFVANGVEKNFIYFSAFEGSLFDTSANAYIRNDEQVYASGDKLCSISNVKPASGRTQALSRINARAAANARGDGWKLQTIQSVSITQLLFLIEYATLNMQSAIGGGVKHKTDDNVSNLSELTGATTALGNQTGSVINSNDCIVISYRGEENFFGNIFKWIDGINIRNSDIYIAEDNYDDNKLDENYKKVKFDLSKYGYISAFGYDEGVDYLFIPSEAKGNSVLPVGDYIESFLSSLTTNITAVLFGGVSPFIYDKMGAFCYNTYYKANTYGRLFGSRLLYVPTT